jgi:hypothetical protein
MAGLFFSRWSEGLVLCVREERLCARASEKSYIILLSSRLLRSRAKSFPAVCSREGAYVSPVIFPGTSDSVYSSGELCERVQC